MFLVNLVGFLILSDFGVFFYVNILFGFDFLAFCDVGLD